jgi:hypothetical protein
VRRASSGSPSCRRPESWAEDLRIHARRATRDARTIPTRRSRGQRASFAASRTFARCRRGGYCGVHRALPGPRAVHHRDRPQGRAVVRAVREDPRSSADGRALDAPGATASSTCRARRRRGVVPAPFKDKHDGEGDLRRGRYVDSRVEGDGPYTLDFNAPYAPSCAYGDRQRFQCPVTPPENTLPLRVGGGGSAPDESPKVPSSSSASWGGEDGVGQGLARRLDRAFLGHRRAWRSLPAGMPIEAIFRERGEGRFREIEWDVLRDAAGRARGACVATGGGTFLGSCSARSSGAAGRPLWLDASFGVIASRLGRGRASSSLGPEHRMRSSGARCSSAAALRTRSPTRRSMRERDRRGGRRRAELAFRSLCR